MGTRLLNTHSKLLLASALTTALNVVTAAELAHAGACCGGSSSVAGVILGDEKYLFGADLDSRVVETDVSAQGVWRDRTEAEQQQTLKFHFTSLFSDRLQTGISPSLTKKTRFGESETSFGDLSLHVAYEALPDWDYHPFRPRGTVYVNASLPTGRSVYESESRAFLDANGKGYPTLGLGAIFNKRFSHWTTIVSGEFHHGLPKDMILPSWGYNVSASVSLDLSKWVRGYAIQGGLSHIFQNGFHLNNGNTYEPVHALQVTTPSVGVSFSPELEDPLVIHLTYSDQRLLGQPLNSPLGKNLIVGIRKQVLR